MMCRFGSSNHIPSLLYFLMHFENLIQYSECISLVPRTYNPIKNGPWELVCDAEKGFITPVTITLPSGMTGVSCTPASPPFPYSCTFAAGYNGDMYESSNIVVINTTSLQDVNGTWSCGHNSETATYELNPIISIPELKFGISPEIFSENISRSTPSFGLSVTYGCINVPVTFEWSAVSVESNAEVNLQISSTISVNSSICSVPDVYGYTTAIDTSDIFNVASGLSGFYSLKVEVHYTSGITALNSKEYPFLFIFSQSTDSCDFNYFYCIGYTLLADFIASGICTLVVYVWWKIKRKEIKAKSILCWLAEQRFCCCGQHILCCCSQKIKRFCEKYKNTRIWGARVLLLADVFVIGMVVSVVVWLFAVIVVIFTCCACKEGLVAGISLVLSLLASPIWTAIVLIVYGIASCCKNNGCVCKPDNRVTKEAGDDVNFLEQRAHEFKRIKSIDLTKDGKPVSSDKYEVEMTAVPSLTLKMVSLDQSGKYECTISYDLTKKEVHRLNLLVTPKQYEVKMGDRKTLLNCLKNLNGIEDVKWTYNNKAIPADSCLYRGGTRSNPSLTVKCCSTSDSGLYICNIRTTKSSKRFSAQLKTKDKYTVGSGKNIDLLKDLSSCRDIRKITWELNGNPLELVDNPSYIGGTIDCPVLTVYCATKQESGKYKCTLVLESQSTKELQFTLDLNEQFRVDSGESIVLLDQLGSSNNVSSVEWTHKKRPVTCLHKGGTNEYPALTIPVVSLEDSGEYECEIKLQHGKIRLYRFVVKVNVQKIKKKVGDKVILLQNLKSAGTIQAIDWYKNGERVQAGKDEKYQGGINQSPGLLVGSLKKDDSGVYKCDLIVKESQITLHILVDLTVEQEEKSTRLGPVIGHNRVSNHDNSTENNQSWKEEEQ